MNCPIGLYPSANAIPVLYKGSCANLPATAICLPKYAVSNPTLSLVVLRNDTAGL